MLLKIPNKVEDKTKCGGKYESSYIFKSRKHMQGHNSKSNCHRWSLEWI